MAQDQAFSAFAGTDENTWKEKVRKDLKADAYSELIATNLDGLPIEPVYTSENYVPTWQPLKEHPKWDNVYATLVEDPQEANRSALEYLNRGASSLLFYLSGGVDLNQLLEGIQLEYICLNLVTDQNPQALAQAWSELIRNRGIEENELEGSLNFDPLENLARTGNWFQSEAQDFAHLKASLEALPPGIKGLCINANLFANAGATLGQQLGIALAMAYEYLHRLDWKDTRSFWCNFAVGSDYFGEIAKLRAIRRLWWQMQKELGLAEHGLRLYAESSQRNKTIAGRYNNLVRSTAEAMAAAIGGASEIYLFPFNTWYAGEAHFGQRLALNQLSILQHESHFHQVRDMAQGAYAIEAQTENLARFAWNFFREIESQGGYIAALKKGWLQKAIAEKAALEQEAFDRGDLPRVGANLFRDESDPMRDWAQHAYFYSPPQAPFVVEPLPCPRLSEKLEASLLSPEP